MGSPLKLYNFVVFCNPRRIRRIRRAQDSGQLGRFSNAACASTPAAADQLLMPKTLTYLKDGESPTQLDAEKTHFSFRQEF